MSGMAIGSMIEADRRLRTHELAVRNYKRKRRDAEIWRRYVSFPLHTFAWWKDHSEHILIQSILFLRSKSSAEKKAKTLITRTEVCNVKFYVAAVRTLDEESIRQLYPPPMRPNDTERHALNSNAETGKPFSTAHIHNNSIQHHVSSTNRRALNAFFASRCRISKSPLV